MATEMAVWQGYIRGEETCSIGRRLTYVIGLAWGLTSCMQGWAQSSPEVIERAEKSVVRIEVRSSQGKAQGSGFVVDQTGIVVTNCHVIENSYSASVVFPNNETAIVTGIRHLDINRDIAIIKIDRSGCTPIPLAAQIPRKGESVIALGSPHGLSFTVTRGIVSAIRSSEEMRRDAKIDDAEGNWLQVDAALSPGNSGGPIINETGQVVAMSTLSFQKIAENVNFGISAGDIQSAVASSASKPWQPLSVGAKTSRKAPANKEYNEVFDEIVDAIPDELIHEFASQIESNLPQYKKELAQQQIKMKAFLREITQAKVDTSIAGSDGKSMRRKIVSVTRGKPVEAIYFSSIDAKLRKKAEIEARVKELDQVISRGRITTLDGWKVVLCLAGTSIDLGKTNSIGIVRNAKQVGRNEDVLVAELDRRQFILFTEDASDVTMLDSQMSAFIGVVVTPRGPLDLPLLCQLPDAKLGPVLLGEQYLSSNTKPSSNNTAKSPSNPNPSSKNLAPSLSQVENSTSKPPIPSASDNGYREWNDRTGSYSLVAKLISSSATHVVLKKKDATVISVEIQKLCEADQRYLDALE